MSKIEALEELEVIVVALEFLIHWFVFLFLLFQIFEHISFSF